jgi:integrase
MEDHPSFKNAPANDARKALSLGLPAATAELRKGKRAEAAQSSNLGSTFSGYARGKSVSPIEDLAFMDNDGIPQAVSGNISGEILESLAFEQRKQLSERVRFHGTRSKRRAGDAFTGPPFRLRDHFHRSWDSLSDGFKALVGRAGLPICSFHSMRHIHGSALLRAGGAPHVAAKRLGHLDGGRLLLATYAHVTDADQHGAAARVGLLLKK